MRTIRRFWPLSLLLAAVIAIWASGLAQQINWASLGRHQAALIAWVTTHPLSAPALYLLIYIVTVALSVPQSAVLTVAGGLLFGTIFGGMLAITGSTLGATALFLAVRYHLADALAGRGGQFLERLRPELERNGFSFLLAIRIVPAFPFWLINLAAALGGMRLLPYVAATFIGIMPATFIYASIGAGIGNVLAAGGRPDLGIIFTPYVLGPLVGLGLLSLLPIAWRRWKRSDA
jgi:uncharacterized membrane protein YdjX (TVP38/TMEM64 family)